MRYIDLFGGIGGFRLGIKKATRGKWKCVGYYDINKYSASVYNKRFGENHEAKNIRNVKEGEIPEHDIICAGFPCQSFSIAGKRKGFEDTRGTLFFEICRIARFHRPKFIFLENVRGLLSHDKGRTFGTILNSLQELGYCIEWQVLNSKNFGVPQNRERVFIIGHLGGFGGRQVFPIGEGNGVLGKENEREQEGRERIQGKIIDGYNKTVRKDEKDENAKTLRSNEGCHTAGNLVSTIDGRYGAWRNAGETYIVTGKDDVNLKQIGNIDKKGHNSIWGRVYDPEGIATNLNAEGGGLGAKTGLYEMKVANAVTPDAYLARGERKRVNGRAVLTSMHEKRIRRLTPIECERLQGFPDDWTKYGVDGGKDVEISDTQRYKMLGNAVTVNVIEMIVGKWVV